MARFSTAYGIDMAGGEDGDAEVRPGSVVRADADEVVIGTDPSYTVYKGRFTFPGDEWRGTIESIRIFYDGEELWSLSGVSISPRSFAVGDAVVDFFRHALDRGDRIYGSSYADRLLGFDGDDRISAKTGNDVVHGGDGADTLYGGRGADKLTGGDGRDHIEGGSGDDRLFGGKYSDVFAFDGSDGRDRIYDFRNGADRIEITDGARRFSQLDVTRDGDDVRIAFDDTVIILADTRLSEIGAEDFIF